MVAEVTPNGAVSNYLFVELSSISTLSNHLDARQKQRTHRARGWRARRRVRERASRPDTKGHAPAVIGEALGGEGDNKSQRRSELGRGHEREERDRGGGKEHGGKREGERE
eukprot:3936657-Rhodomonas_salina.1